MSTQSIYDMIDTWNAGATTFTAIKMNVTDTASSAGSLLMSLQKGGIEQFSVAKDSGVSIRGSDKYLRLYNLDTDASNYERASLRWSSNFFRLDIEAAGTGSARDMVLNGAATRSIFFQIGSTSRWQINASGHLLGATDNTYDIGASGATRPRIIYVGTRVQTVNFAATGAQIDMTALPTADPAVAGRLWSNSGVVTVSAG